MSVSDPSRHWLEIFVGWVPEIFHRSSVDSYTAAPRSHLLGQPFVNQYQQEEALPVFIAVIVAILLSITDASAAPRQLYGKGIEIQYSVTATMETPSGPRSGTSNVRRTIYVSSTGRLFERAAWAVPGGARVSDNAPDAATNKAGEARGMSFRGNDLVAHVAYASGAGQMTIHFDPTFSSCEGSVRFGSEGGKAIYRRVKGQVRQLTSLQASSVACRVTAGNPLQ
jgi:hypothetical protein